MRIDDCYQIGYIVKTHGLKGEVTIELDVDFPEQYNELESVFLDKSGTLIPFFISSILLHGNKATIKFDDIDTLSEAKELTGSKLYRPVSELPKLSKGQYYYHDLIGFDVFESGSKLGVITNVYQPSSQWLAGLMYKESEILIPITDEIFREVDVETQTIEVELPDGLLDIYLEK